MRWWCSEEEEAVVRKEKAVSPRRCEAELKGGRGSGDGNVLTVQTSSVDSSGVVLCTPIVQEY